MSKLLSDARQLCESANLPMKNNKMDVDEYIRVWDARKALLNMMPELLDYAEMREAQAIELKAKIDYPNYDDLPEEDHAEKRCIGDKGDFHELHYRGKRTLRVEVAKELSADLSAWHKITEEEREAIQDAILCFKAYERDEKETIEVLRGMIR